MGKKRSSKKKDSGKRLAVMVGQDTHDMIYRLCDVLAKERDMESPVNANDAVRTAVREALKKRGL